MAGTRHSLLVKRCLLNFDNSMPCNELPVEAYFVGAAEVAAFCGLFSAAQSW